MQLIFVYLVLFKLFEITTLLFTEFIEYIRSIELTYVHNFVIICVFHTFSKLKDSNLFGKVITASQYFEEKKQNL